MQLIGLDFISLNAQYFFLHSIVLIKNYLLFDSGNNSLIYKLVYIYICLSILFYDIIIYPSP